MIAIVGTTNIFIAQQKRANYKLSMAQSKIEQLAALAERERIARDLHDVLGHTLSVIVLKAELAGRLIERDPERAAQEMADVENTARTALTEVREAIGGYRSRGLPDELESARRALSAAGVGLACESPLPVLGAAQETVVCLAVREAVTNIVRHAHATHCTMRFATTDDNYSSLAIGDDGTHPMLQEGNGLRGMRERVEAMGGRFAIDNKMGTRLLIELPNYSAKAATVPCVTQ
jgi:two-component system sensor histidine kinase DesK